MAQRFAAALQAIDEWVGERGVPGVGAVVWQGGEAVAERYAGEARPGQPVTAKTLFAMASVTKPVSAATVLTLVDAGLLSLDEPVGRIVPEFRATGELNPELERLRPRITTRQLLSHVSGLPEDLGSRESRYTQQVGIDEVVDQMLRTPLVSAPGEELRYSNTGFGVLTRVVERVDGRPFWDVARDRVLEPLGLRDIVPDPQGADAARTAALADSLHAGTEIETYNGAYWRSLALPWGGLFGSPRDAARFAGAFLQRGEGVLSPAVVGLATQDQTLGVPGGVESARVHWPQGAWGLGWEVKGPKRNHWTGDLTSPRTFCHFGHAGTLLWADPERDLALAVFSNRAVTNMWSFILSRWARLSNAVVAASGV
ncbi:MAG: serine hydrolase domain-containing protein [Thermomicrobiales bacterium]